MQIPVLIERIAGDGYRARGGEPLAFSAEGATREEALARFKEQIRARLSNGAEMVSVELPSAPSALAEFAGMFKDDPLFDDWQKAIADYRREVENDPDYL
jgi:predicted RNase H-like HicB family nuclease